MNDDPIKKVREVMYAAQPLTGALPWGEAHAAFALLLGQYTELSRRVLDLHTEVGIMLEFGTDRLEQLQLVHERLESIREFTR